MRLHAYASFDGRCAEAMRFYADLLRGELEIIDVRRVSRGRARAGLVAAGHDENRVAVASPRDDNVVDVVFPGVDGMRPRTDRTYPNRVESPRPGGPTAGGRWRRTNASPSAKGPKGLGG